MVTTNQISSSLPAQKILSSQPVNLSLCSSVSPVVKQSDSVTSEPVLSLPTDFARTPSTPYQAASHPITLPHQVLESLKSHAALNSHDTQVLLLTALHILLYRYTQQDTLQLTVTLRDGSQLIAATTRLTTLLAAASTSRALIQQLKDSLTSLPPSDPSPNNNLSSQTQTPIIPSGNREAIALTFVQASPSHDELAPEWRQPEPTQVESNPPAELDLLIVQQPHTLSGVLTYNAHLFQPGRIERLCNHLHVVLAAMLCDLDCPIAHLPLLTPAETQQLLIDWSSDRSEFPTLPIHRYIEQHAIEQPDAIAASFNGEHLTYAQLNQRANQLAHRLIHLGVGANVPVAVCVAPSLDIVVSLLAIFKSGGVHVPLDPTYPADRLSAIAEDTQPKLLLTQSPLLPSLPVIAERVFCFDKDWEALQEPTHNPEVEIPLDQTAYLIYTSGTTGKPKGVMTSHGNLVQYLLVAQERYGFNRQDVMPALARFTFSITMFELLSPLVAGGTLMILERDHVLDFKRMVQMLQQVTVVHASPSLLRKLLTYIKDNNLDIQKFQNLRHVSSGGDMVPADLLASMKATFPAAEIYVIYGCSEVSCMGCTYPVTDDVVTKSRVGKPFNNVSVRLYDSQQNLVPIGIVGEIYFAGAGVTQGYLNRPELTEEKFVTIDGQRFYRTGDLGRFDADGNLEILGRSDFQIQLRGLRIELGDVESALRQAPGVREGLVAARELSNGEPGLVAYVVLDQDEAGSIIPKGELLRTDAIRRFLQTKLPDYMVPAAFVPLEAMPLNVNGKVDRRALPAPNLGNVDTAYVAPRTPLEESLAELWATILGLEQVGINDDFFALGGHSLMAAQVIYRLQETLNLEIPISRLFERPTIAALAEYLDSLDETTSVSCRDRAPITRISREAHLSLSLPQSRLWFLTQLEEGIAYNIPLAFNLTGALQITALEQSLTEIVRRHEALRTTFPVVNGAPVQLILPPQPLPLPLVDVESLPEPDQTVEVKRLAQEEAQRPFNLAEQLPIRATLLRRADTSHVLLLTIHHIVADGWSLAVFRRELAALYTSCLQGVASPLEELPVQYADFAHWQQQWMQGAASQHLAYWQEKLAGVPPLLEIPTDRPRPPMQTYRGGTEFFTLDADLTHRLKLVSQQAGSTLFMTLLAGFATLLSRYSGHQDLVIGSPIANRNRRELEPLIGFFINLLALRIDLTGNPAFVDLLQRVRQVALEAYAHQDAPFEQLVEAVQPERNLSHSPLFQVMFILQNSPVECLELPDLTLTSLKVESGTAKYDLTLMMEELDGGVVAEFEYNRDLFDRETIIRMVGHFQTLLQAIATKPTQPISALSLLTEPERQQLLVTWNDTQMEYPEQPCLHQLIEAQVERTPDAIAAVFDQQHLTYRELNQQANQLGHYLQSLGVGPEVLVGICVERSLEMLVGLLGILKAGGSYVPLDPAYPKDRLAYMIEDSRLPLLLTQQALRDQFSEQNVQVVCLDTDWTAISQQSQENPVNDVAPENLAYTIYTSGSTGKPKGVQLYHRTVVNFLNSMRWQPGLTAQDILLSVTTISFDIAVLELYLPLMVGARTVIVPRDAAADAAKLMSLLTESGATMLQATPATWQMLIAGGWQGDRRLKMLCGGEAMPRDMANKLLDRGGSLWNMYGPTETTVWSAACQVTPGQGSVPVAGPIANTQIYVLERSSFNLAPIGIPGEVHIGGDGLARGYLNRPELTQERFVPDPFSDAPDARLYKTGDLARFRPNGTLEFLGRIDNQVKLRGFRIELGEIEAVLNLHAAVKQAVVVVRQDAPGDQRLVAYLTLKGDSTPTPQELRQLLKEHLPGYMIPSAFVVLEALPLTPNGKVDRRALPAPDVSGSQESAEFVAPRNDTERQLAEIWQDVLGINSIGIHDNFFEIGGHSLSAVRVWAQIEQRFSSTLPLSTLMTEPTIEQLAPLLSPSGQLQERQSIVLIRPGGSKPPVFLIHDGEGEVLLYRNLANYLSAEHPVYGIQPYSRPGCPILHTRIEDMAAYYLDRIRQVQPAGPYLLGGLCVGGTLAFEIARQLQSQGETVDMVALIDTADVEAPRSSLVANQRLSRVSQSLGQNQQPSLRQLLCTFHTLGQKAYNLISYEVLTKVQKTQNQVKMALFRHYLDQGLPVPRFVQNIPVRVAMQFSQNEYAPQDPYKGKVALFRATEKSSVFDGTDIDDTPYIEKYSDPLLGWEKRVTEGVDVYDIPGGHSSMLQEPNAVVIAEKMQAYIDTALAKSSNTHSA